MADRDVAYVPEREEEVDRLLNVREKVDWVMHADNQRALFDEFYRTVVPSQSLVFFYAKHTPLAEDPQRVLVGAALVKQVRLPGSYASDGPKRSGQCPGRRLSITRCAPTRPAASCCPIDVYLPLPTPTHP